MVDVPAASHRNTRRRTLNGFIGQVVLPNVALLATDGHPAYGKLKAQYPHEIVRHCNHQYVQGMVHTNSIESFWALLKRGVMGSFHQFSRKYLPLYLAEFTLRHNHRQAAHMFDWLIAGCGAPATGSCSARGGGQECSATQSRAITLPISGASVMAITKEEPTVHSVASKIAQALLKIKPDKGRRRRKRQGKPPR